MSSPLHKTLGIPSQEEADELELDLGIRFHDLTHDQRETWKQQTVYLGLYAQTRTFTHAARAAGVSIRKVRLWQAENTLGFNRRLQYAVLEYTEEIDLMLLRHARKPDCPPSLLMMFLRSQMPEKYGPARRESASPNGHCDHHHDDPARDTSQHDHDPRDDIPRDIHDLKQFAGLTEPPALSPAHTVIPAPSPVIPAHAGIHPPTPSAPNPPQNPAPSTQNPSPPSVRPEPVEGPKPDSQTTPTVIPAHAGIHPPTPSAPNPPQNPAPSTQNPSPPSAPSAANPPAPSTQPPEPSLNRRQRRQLQRKQRKHAPSPETGTKQPNSHRPRAPTN